MLKLKKKGGAQLVRDAIALLVMIAIGAVTVALVIGISSQMLQSVPPLQPNTLLYNLSKTFDTAIKRDVSEPSSTACSPPSSSSASGCWCSAVNQCVCLLLAVFLYFFWVLVLGAVLYFFGLLALGAILYFYARFSHPAGR